LSTFIETDLDACLPKRSLPATVTILYPGGGENRTKKWPASSVKAGLSLMLKKEIFSALPSMVTAVVEVALQALGEIIVMTGPSKSRRASNNP